MTRFDRFVLGNGLRVLVHEDRSTPMAVVNVLYDVGARDEEPGRTGFAHLFEHLMFGGSVNIPVYDDPMQRAGGENNAYTTNDLTNYYCQLPADNLETAFWLESDRMLSLAFSEKSLDVQRKVVCEEFREHYINKPYGDVWKLLRDLAYREHPYRWMTIGRELSHIEKATLSDVRAFFHRHYNPVNAILVVAGSVGTNAVRVLAEKWFGDIPSGERYHRSLPAEPVQLAPRSLEVRAKVPLDAFHRTWHMSGRLDVRYHAADLMSDMLGSGGSSRLYQSLVKVKKLFSSIDCYHFGSLDPGLVAIEGKLVKGVSMDTAESAVEEELEKMRREPVLEKELQKVKNKTESLLAFEDMSVVSRASNIAFYELLGDAELMNRELDCYRAVTVEQVFEECRTVFRPENSATLRYFAEA